MHVPERGAAHAFHACVRVHRTIAPSLLAAATLLAAAPARAEDPDTARARALFERAGELERQGQWTAAQDKLRLAIKIRETPHLRYALGWALENDDKLLEAKAEYETAARLARGRAGADEVSRLAAGRLEEVERKTPRVEIRVADRSGGARVVVDGHTTPLAGDVVTVPVNPGSRVVRVERTGRPAYEQLVYVPRGMVRVVEVPGGGVAARTGEEERHDAAARWASPVLRPESARPHALPVVLTAAGAALAIGGGALFASSAADASARDDSMRAWCDATACVGGTTATRPESAEATQHRRGATDAASRGNTKQILGATIGGIGLVGAAVGAYLLVRGKGDERRAGFAVPIAAPVAGGGVAGASFRF